jgi:hypothetical protein
MRPQNAMLLIVAVLGTMARPTNAQMMPAKPDVIRQQLGEAQAAQSGQAKPASPKPAAQPQPAPVAVKSAQPAPTADKPAASAKPVAAAKPVTANSAQATDSAKAPAQAKDVPAGKSAKTQTAAKTGNPGAKPVSADAAQPKLTPAVDKKAVAAADAGKPAPGAAPTAVKQADAGGPKRDPFSPLVSNAKDSGSGGPDHLPPGKAGLMVGTMRLDGLVRGPNGMIAVVSNPQDRVYFLREGDRIFDGQVTKITLEAVSFMQSGRDSFGNGLEHEVTRRLYATPGEQR